MDSMNNKRDPAHIQMERKIKKLEAEILRIENLLAKKEGIPFIKLNWFTKSAISLVVSFLFLGLFFSNTTLIIAGLLVFGLSSLLLIYIYFDNLIQQNQSSKQSKLNIHELELNKLKSQLETMQNQQS